MATKYTQLTEEQRYQIQILFAEGNSQGQIAKKIGYHKSTISRELKRNASESGYKAKLANVISQTRKKTALKKIKFTSTLQEIVTEKLKNKWSPEQISGYLKKEGLESISHERIYQYVWKDKKQGGELYKHLRQASKKYKKRRGSKDSRGQIPGKISIDQRPPEVDLKQRFGDWEGDTIVGKDHDGYLVTLVERTSKLTLIRKVSSKTADAVEKAIIEALSPYKSSLKSITFDNGKEFANHLSLTATLGVAIYFAHPYSSWERGLNENTNGLIRQYIPKKTRINGIDEAFIKFVEKALNSRPRKTLNYCMPEEIFMKKSKEAA